MPTACLLYNAATTKEAKAPLGSDLRALVMPYGIGQGSILTSSFYKYAGGSNAINPSRKAAVSTNFFRVDP